MNFSDIDFTNRSVSNIYFVEVLINDAMKYQLMSNTKHVLNLFSDLRNIIKILRLPHAFELRKELKSIMEDIHQYTGIVHSAEDKKELVELVQNAENDISDEVDVILY